VAGGRRMIRGRRRSQGRVERKVRQTGEEGGRVGMYVERFEAVVEELMIRARQSARGKRDGVRQ
jgi:hypothetical protein